MAICSKCGAQLFETSKFCPECGTPVLEVSADTNKTGDIYSASENADDENSMAVFQGIDPSEISPDETAEILEAAAEKALEDIPEIVKIEGVDIHNEKPGEIASELPEAAEAPEAPKTPEAPKAETVEVSGFGGTLGTEKIALEKQANGLFSKNVKGILPGFHYHRWFVDGVQVTNPHAPFAYGCFGANNFFEMPREGQDFWYLKDVPHGDVQIHSYVSTQNDHIKKCYVYLPPSYRENIDQKYPVMYIQHGVGEDETSWLWNGKLNFIMDNLIAEGKCKGMIVVMCSGYAFRDDEEAVFFPGDFGRELTEDVIPYMEHTFRVKKGRMHRAMAGLSLGSAQATQIVSRFQNLFGHLGVFSGVRDEETERILAQFAEYPMQTVLMTAGKGEKDLDKKQKGRLYESISDIRRRPCV